MSTSRRAYARQRSTVRASPCEGVPFADIQQLMGHDDPRTTSLRRRACGGLTAALVMPAFVSLPTRERICAPRRTASHRYRLAFTENPKRVSRTSPPHSPIAPSDAAQTHLSGTPAERTVAATAPRTHEVWVRSHYPQRVKRAVLPDAATPADTDEPTRLGSRR
jgi:hypothetical protein